MCDLFTKGSHHRNISVILITQNLFHQGKFCRDISLNAKYIVVLKNVREREQFSHLARQVLPHDSKGLSDAYLNATEEPHGYLVLHLSLDTNDRLRFLTCIFLEEPPIFYVDIGNETRKRKFSHPSRAKKRSAKITKSNYIKLRQRPRELISDCVLDVLKGNVTLTGCVIRKLSKHRLALRRVVDRRVPL